MVTVPTVSVAGHPVEIIRQHFDCQISISPYYIGPTKTFSKINCPRHNS